VKTKDVLDGLERECKQIGVKLVYDELQSEGGLCRAHDSYYVIINRRASAETRIRIIRDSLADIRRRERGTVSEAPADETLRAVHVESRSAGSDEPGAQ